MPRPTVPIRRATRSLRDAFLELERLRVDADLVAYVAQHVDLHLQAVLDHGFLLARAGPADRRPG